MSSAETRICSPVWMHNLSDMHEEAEKAQQEPHWDWSQILWVDSQCDHSSRTSKDFGGS